MLFQEGAEAPRAANVTIGQAVIAGWTGRDTAGLQHRIDDLKALGVKPASSVPLS